MSRQLFAKNGVPAVGTAALLMAGVAWAGPRPPGPPALHAARPAMMARPARPPGGHFGGGFSRPNFFLSRPNGLVRPNVGRSPSLLGPCSGGWTPPAVNRNWARPTANLVAGRRTEANQSGPGPTANPVAAGSATTSQSHARSPRNFVAGWGTGFVRGNPFVFDRLAYQMEGPPRLAP
jgi:hypothetical protein